MLLNHRDLRSSAPDPPCAGSGRSVASRPRPAVTHRSSLCLSCPRPVSLRRGSLRDRPFPSPAVEFHLRNATAWANEATGQNLADQVDPDFRHGPAALAAFA